MNQVTTVLVTGANGFLGRELIQELLSKSNINVVAMTSNKEVLISKFGEITNLKVIDSNEYFIEEMSNSDIDVLVNCAFPRTSKSNELTDAMIYTEKLIKKSFELNVKKVINISSQSVYSQKSLKIPTEDSKVEPDSFYGLTKFSCERIVSMLCQSKDVTFSNIRLASLAGLDLDVRMTNRFVKSALEETPISITGGKQQLSYLHVKDAAIALVAMIRSEISIWHPVYNLGNIDSCTVLELAEKVEYSAKKNSELKVQTVVSKGDSNFSNIINSELFCKKFKWQPKYTMTAIVDELFQYYAE